MRPLQAGIADSWGIDERGHVRYVLSNQAVKEVDVGVTKVAEIEIFVDILRRSL